MCRSDSQPGGPRRCGKHMRERLDAATIVLEQANATLLERTAARRARQQAAEKVRERGVAGRAARDAEKALARTTAAWSAANQARNAAALAVARAQANYDSTREGLHHLRGDLDSGERGGDTVDRFHDARRAYDREAALREIEFGPQAPLSQVGLESTALGRALIDVDTLGWLKSLPTPDRQTGVYVHRLNLVRLTAAGVRKSKTIPYLSSQPVSTTRLGEDPTRTTGEPTLADVAYVYTTQILARQDHDSYERWRMTIGSPDSQASRARWRSTAAVSSGLRSFLGTTLYGGLFPSALDQEKAAS